MEQANVRNPPHFALTAVFLFLACCLVPAAQAQISNPVLLGQNFTIRLIDRDIDGPVAPKGASIPVAASVNAMAGAVFATCSDSAGNTYPTDVSGSGGIELFGFVCSTHGIVPSPASAAMIRVSKSGVFPDFSMLVQAFFITGLLKPVLDRTAVDGGNVRRGGSAV